MNANGRDFSSDDVSFVPKKHQLLKRPETAPLLTEFWQPPPTFDQHRRGKPKPRYTFEPGLNALWRADFCYCKKQKCILPSVVAYPRVKVRHSSLHVDQGWPSFTRISVPLVWICYIELVETSEHGTPLGRMIRRVTEQLYRGRLEISGRNLFKMTMWLSAKSPNELVRIRDWLRFLVSRQRIPHQLLGLEFEWKRERAKPQKMASRIIKLVSRLTN